MLESPVAQANNAAAASAAPAGQTAQLDSTAQAFVRGLYGQYNKPEYVDAKGHAFDPLRDGHAERWFTPEIVRLQSGDPKMKQYEANVGSRHSSPIPESNLVCRQTHRSQLSRAPAPRLISIHILEANVEPGFVVTCAEAG